MALNEQLEGKRGKKREAAGFFIVSSHGHPSLAVSLQRDTPPPGVPEVLVSVHPETMSEAKKKGELALRDKAVLHQQRRLKQATQFSHKDSADLLPLDGLKRLGTSKDLVSGRLEPLGS